MRSEYTLKIQNGIIYIYIYILGGPSKLHSVSVLNCCKFEGGHPVVYRQLFIVLVPSIHKKYKDQMH